MSKGTSGGYENAPHGRRTTVYLTEVPHLLSEFHHCVCADAIPPAGCSQPVIEPGKYMKAGLLLGTMGFPEEGLELEESLMAFSNLP